MKASLLSLLFFISLLSVFAANATSKEETFPLLKGPLIEINADEKLTIRMIPHSHDDIGWLKTVDQYYITSEKDISIQGVQYIFDSVFPLLNMDTKKRFMYVEMGFFQRWWEEADLDMKNLVQRLVKNGQFEFVNGGYCMNDEASVYYEDSIDQMTLGHQFLLQNFGVTPNVGWHIDPFGHANAQAALFAQMGFKAFFFSRIDYQDKQKRLKDKAMEMLWMPETSQGIENAMFTHVNYYHYSNPDGFNFDVIGRDQPIQDNSKYGGYDVPKRADAFLAWFRQMRQSYLTTDLFHTAGDDFHYMAAGMDFKNYDKLFKYIKNTPSYKADCVYNTPIEYLSAIYPQSKSYPVKHDDFFPYADGSDAYWTGYFTSRVAYKGLVRKSGRFLQAVRRLASQCVWEKSSNFINNNFNQVDNAIGVLEDAMGMAQHHDAVTGTERQLVTEDYKLHMARGLNNVTQNYLFPYYKEKINKDLGISNAVLEVCQLNTSSVFCGTTYQNIGKSNVLLTIYNSGVARDSVVRVKVPNGNVQVKDSTGVQIPTDVICANSTDSKDCDLFFRDNFGAFETSYYYLVASTSSNLVAGQDLSYGRSYDINSNQSIVANNASSYSLSYCLTRERTNCFQPQFVMRYNYYEGYQVMGQTSGAYIFRPSDKTKTGSLPYSTPSKATIYRGKNLIQIQIDGKTIISSLRIYNDITNGIELQSFVDSINIADGQGKEIVLDVQVPSIKNNNVFYTDSMGMEMQKRTFNYRPTWDLNVSQPVSGNYYPVQSTIAIQDASTNEGLAIIPDRSQGGASLSQGHIELMIHRRLKNDDYRGVAEPLNELDWDGQGMRQWVTHTLLFTKPGFLETSFRQVQLNQDVAQIHLLAPTTKTPFFDKNEQKTSSLAFGDFGADIKLLTRPLTSTKFVLRFQNMNEKETKTVSTQVFKNPNYSKGTVTEMSLTYNQAKTDMIKKRFNWNGLKLNNPDFAKTDYLTSDKFSLRPQEIRTFVVSFGNSAESIEL